MFCCKCEPGGELRGRLVHSEVRTVETEDPRRTKTQAVNEHRHKHWTRGHLHLVHIATKLRTNALETAVGEPPDEIKLVLDKLARRERPSEGSGASANGGGRTDRSP
jgi:hypothetical protein